MHFQDFISPSLGARGVGEILHEFLTIFSVGRHHIPDFQRVFVLPLDARFFWITAFQDVAFFLLLPITLGRFLCTVPPFKNPACLNLALACLTASDVSHDNLLAIGCGVDLGFTVSTT